MTIEIERSIPKGDYSHISISDIQKMADVASRSGLFGITQPAQAMALMLLTQAEGMHPMLAVRDYHIIKGRQSLRADAMLARFQSSGGSIKWIKLEDDEVVGEFSHPQGGTAKISWSIGRATKAGLVGDNWKKYPRAMLRSRCISEGIRSVFPGSIAGVYTKEEVEDIIEEEKNNSASREASPAPIEENIYSESNDEVESEIIEIFNSWTESHEKMSPEDFFEFLKEKIMEINDSNSLIAYQTFISIEENKNALVKFKKLRRDYAKTLSDMAIKRKEIVSSSN